MHLLKTIFRAAASIPLSLIICLPSHAAPLVEGGYSVVGAGVDFTVAVKADGSLWTWGKGALGDGVTQRFEPKSIGSDFRSVAVATYSDDSLRINSPSSHVVAMKADGSIWSWRDNERPMQLGTGFSAFAAGPSHTLALKPDGTLWAWGDNSVGQFGDGTTVSSQSPKKVGEGYTAIAAGNTHSIALKADGSLWGWGSNERAQVGVVQRGSILSPIQIGSGYRTVSAYLFENAAVKSDGTVWTWGGAFRNYLNGEVSFPSDPAPQQVGKGFQMAVRHAWGTLALTASGGLWQLLDVRSDDPNAPAPSFLGQGFVSISQGVNHRVALKADGSLWAWGSDRYGQFGFGENPNFPHPMPEKFSTICTGGQTSLAVKPDGSLWGWGFDLGEGAQQLVDAPKQIGSGYAAVACGYGFNLALKTDGQLLSWGINGLGQLGNGTLFGDGRFPTVIGQGFVRVFAGASSAVALKADGGLWAWGSSNFGFVDRPRLVPTQIGVDYTTAAVGGEHTLAVKADGRLSVIGHNERGQLGDGTRQSIGFLSSIGRGYISVAAGRWHSLGLRADGSLWAWGANDYGQVGDGGTTDVLVPTLVATGVVAIAAGPFNSFAIKNDGSLWAWGSNELGQLGDGSRSYDGITVSRLPKKIGSGFVSVAPGQFSTAALKGDGQLWVWGESLYGKYSDGRAENSALPIQVTTGYPVPPTAALSDCLFDWAAKNHPNFFAPDGTLSQTSGSSYFRFYSQSAAYLSISAQTQRLSYFGPLAAGVLDLGDAMEWYGIAGCK
jgi:alpha-tubulin suppressor-like RCC1 family protein